MSGKRHQVFRAFWRGLSARFAWIAAGGMLIGLGACSEPDPLSVYYSMATAAEFGDREGFLAGMTDDSRRLVEAQLNLSEAYGLRNENPVTMLVFPEVQRVWEEDDRAYLEVARGNTRRRLVMVKTEEGAWRLDVKVLAEFWEKERRRAY